MSTTGEAVLTNFVGCVPIDLWSRDHWSTLAYLETRLVDGKGFRIGLDPRMKTSSRHLRRMGWEEYYQDKAARDYILARGQPVMLPEHATILNDGRQIREHDDWSCVEDFIAAGVVRTQGNRFYAGYKVRLTRLGHDICAALREHKAKGGNFAAFRWEGKQHDDRPPRRVRRNHRPGREGVQRLGEPSRREETTDAAPAL